MSTTTRNREWLAELVNSPHFDHQDNTLCKTFTRRGRQRIAHVDKPLTMDELADTLNITRMTLHRRLTTLEAAGLIRRRVEDIYGVTRVMVSPTAHWAHVDAEKRMATLMFYYSSHAEAYNHREYETHMCFYLEPGTGAFRPQEPWEVRMHKNWTQAA